MSFTTSKCIYMGSTDDGKEINYIEGECMQEDVATLPIDVYNGSKVAVMDQATLLMFNADASEWLPWRR